MTALHIMMDTIALVDIANLYVYIMKVSQQVRALS